MEDVTELISKVSQELRPDTSDEEISEMVLQAMKRGDGRMGSGAVAGANGEGD